MTTGSDVNDNEARVRAEQYRNWRELDDAEHDAWCREQVAELHRIEHENDGCLVKPIAYGARTYGDGASTLLWWLFDREAVETAVGVNADSYPYHLAEGLVCRSSTYNGPGQPFTEDPDVRRVTKHRVLICQHVGRDI